MMILEADLVTPWLTGENEVQKGHCGELQAILSDEKSEWHHDEMKHIIESCLSKLGVERQAFYQPAINFDWIQSMEKSG